MSDDNDNLKDLIEIAWGIIANVSGGDWTNQSREWRFAARRWEKLAFPRKPKTKKASK
jgi:hypothetical protein